MKSIQSKDYWLFSGENYYPLGGMEDLIGKFSSLEECAEVLKLKKKNSRYDWAHAYHEPTDTIVDIPGFLKG